MRDLGRDDDPVVAEPDFLCELGATECAGKHRFDVDIACVALLVIQRARVLVHHVCEQILVERAPVDANSDRLVVVDGDLDDRPEILVAALRADVAGVDAVLGQGAGTLWILGEEQVSVVVEVANDGDVDPIVPDAARDLGDRGSRVLVVDRDAHDL